MSELPTEFINEAARARAIVQQAEKKLLNERPLEIRAEVLNMVTDKANNGQYKLTYCFWQRERGQIMEEVIKSLITDGFNVKPQSDTPENIHINISWAL